MSVVRTAGAAALLALCLATAGCSDGSRPYPNHQLEGRVVDGRTLLIPRSQVGRKGSPLAISLVGPEGPRINPERIWAYWLKEPDLIDVHWSYWDGHESFLDGDVLVRVPDSGDHPSVELYRDYYRPFPKDVKLDTGGGIYRCIHRDIDWDQETGDLRFETQECVHEMFDHPQEHAYKLKPCDASDAREAYVRWHTLYEIRRYRLAPGGLEYVGGVKCGETPGWTPAEVTERFGVSEEAFREANRAFPPKGQWALPGNLEPLHPRTLAEAICDAK